MTDAEDEDTCGLCGGPDPDKVASPHYWPGQNRPSGKFVHAACEDEACAFAHGELSDAERTATLREIMRHA